MNPSLKRLWATYALLLAGTAAAADTAYDLVLRNARVVDGTGSPWFRADVAVRGDMIAKISPSISEPSRRVIDLNGLVASPGFIDIHTHVGFAIFSVPTADNHIRQDVSVGPFFTQTGDAWILDPADQLAARLAYDGDPLTIHIEETSTNYSIGWQRRYRIDVQAFVYEDNKSRRLSSITGYPIQLLLRTMAQVQRQ